MIVKEFYKEQKDGIKLYKTYSNEDYKILQMETGNIYDEAIDVENANYTYEEINEKIEREEEKKEEQII